MASAKDKIAAIAVEHGYAGKKPKSVAGAINALADTLAGEDVKGSRSISGAVKALAPYIGSGGGAKLGKLICTLSVKELGGPPPYGWLFTTNAKPVVGGFPNAQALQFVSLSLGSNIVAYNKLWPDSSDGTPITSPVIASGLTVSGYIFDDGLRFDSGTVELYRCNFDFGGYTSVSEFTDFTFENGLLTLVVPELDQSECLAIYFKHQ